MLVYGDHQEVADPRLKLEQLQQRRDAVLSVPAGIGRHAALAGIFIDLASLTQGVADAAFEVSHKDDLRPAEDRLLNKLVTLGGALIRSWNGSLSENHDLPTFDCPVPLPEEVRMRVAEGYAFYALYPEAYALAARRLRLSAEPRIIGLRSIGTGLAAIAAAALGAPRPFTLRPHGHPFRRALAISPQLEAALLEGNPHFVIVDEGPGLSGSSFGAVADWLEDRGVPADRIAFLPGHSGDLGTEASERHRARWAGAQRPVVDASELLGDRLSSWVGDMVGPLSGPLQEISGGQWRMLGDTDGAAWPAVNPTWERQKYLARTQEGTWLVKFAGLGSIGEAKLALSRELHRAGFGSQPAGLAHGWLIERWHSDGRPSVPNIDELVAYLALRRSLAGAGGASVDDLLRMAQRNAPDLLGRWQPDIGRLGSKVRPVMIDGRLERQEWLRLPDGHLLKTDALDHNAGHDLIGCQDVAWDVAGAIVELDLSSGDAKRLSTQMEVDEDLLAFVLRCYLAFRIGARRLSASMLASWPEEAARNIADAERYERLLSALVNGVEHPRDID